MFMLYSRGVGLLLESLCGNKATTDATALWPEQQGSVLMLIRKRGFEFCKMHGKRDQQPGYLLW